MNLFVKSVWYSLHVYPKMQKSIIADVKYNFPHIHPDTAKVDIIFTFINNGTGAWRMWL